MSVERGAIGNAEPGCGQGEAAGISYLHPNSDCSETDVSTQLNRVWPRRILFFVGAFFCIGGIQETVENLAAEFLRQERAVAIFTDRYKLGAPERQPFASAEAAALYIPSQGPASWRHPERLIKLPHQIVDAENELVDRIRRWCPDVVNCHEWQWDRFPIIARACRRAEVPLVFTLYDVCGRGKCGARPLRWLRFAARLNTISLSCKSAIEALLPHPHDIQIIYPGVDVLAAKAAGPYHAKRPYIFSAGRLRIDHKAFDLLVAAFVEVARCYQQVDLLIAGEGPDRAQLQSLILQNGLKDRVRLLGAVSREELWSLHKGSLFFAMPSRMAEGLGLVFMEAMASAKAVIGSAVGGVSEIVSHGRTGLLLERNDVALLVAMLRRFLDEPDNVRRMGEAGYRHMARWRGWSGVADEYLSLYRAGVRR